MTNTGFYSIVQNRFNPDDPNDMLVRTRSKEDTDNFAARLKELADYEAEPWHSTKSDYPYRLTAPREAVEKVVTSYATDIDYTNFKASVRSEKHYDAYSDVWYAMYGHFTGTKTLY